MSDTKSEQRIDVERSAVVRLMEVARRRYQQAVDKIWPLNQNYLEGYMRALEDVLAMENE